METLFMKRYRIGFESFYNLGNEDIEWVEIRIKGQDLESRKKYWRENRQGYFMVVEAEYIKVPVCIKELGDEDS